MTNDEKGLVVEVIEQLEVIIDSLDSLTYAAWILVAALLIRGVCGIVKAVMGYD